MIRSNIANTSNLKNLFMIYAVNFSKQHGYDWMCYLDADEYLVLNKHQSNVNFFGN